MTEVIGAPTRLRDALRRPDARGREVETAMALHLEPFMARNRLSGPDMLRGLQGNIVAICMAKASSLAEAREGVRMVCDEMMRRVSEH